MNRALQAQGCGEAAIIPITQRLKPAESVETREFIMIF